jgi:hypothetical protein
MAKLSVLAKLPLTWMKMVRLCLDRHAIHGHGHARTLPQHFLRDPRSLNRRLKLSSNREHISSHEQAGGRHTWAGRVVADDVRHLLSVRERRMDSNVARQGGTRVVYACTTRDQPTELQ